MPLWPWRDVVVCVLIFYVMLVTLLTCFTARQRLLTYLPMKAQYAQRVAAYLPASATRRAPTTRGSRRHEVRAPAPAKGRLLRPRAIVASRDGRPSPTHESRPSPAARRLAFTPGARGLRPHPKAFTPLPRADLRTTARASPFRPPFPVLSAACVLPKRMTRRRRRRRSSRPALSPCSRRA